MWGLRRTPVDRKGGGSFDAVKPLKNQKKGQKARGKNRASGKEVYYVGQMDETALFFFGVWTLKRKQWVEGKNWKGWSRGRRNSKMKRKVNARGGEFMRS